MAAERIQALVVGAGWSGLAAALTLARAGLRPRLLEAAARPGGRARCIPRRDGSPLDNGQHLLTGACTAVLGLLGRLGLDESAVLRRVPLDLLVHDPGDDLRLRLPALPRPLHCLAAPLASRGLDACEWRALARLWAALNRPPGPERSALAWLEELAQPAGLRRRLWSPLCQAVLNTPLPLASARLFAGALREGFRGPRGHSDLLFPTVPLDELLPAPATRELHAQGAELLTSTRVTAIRPAQRGWQAETSRGVMRADALILALAPWQAARLLAPLPAAGGLAAELGALAPSPVCTLYLPVADTAPVLPPLQGFSTGPIQWLFDHRALGLGARLAGVISGPGTHLDQGRMALAEAAAEQLRATLGLDLDAGRALILRQRRATFLATPAADAGRPGRETGLPGLHLAGDAVQTGLPATLEGAVRSGMQAARGLLTGLQ